MDGGGPDAIGTALFSDFVLAFQLVGVLLLTGIIGAVSLVERKVASRAPAASSPQEERPLETVGS
jgi:membrane glycosyltransferase